MSVDLAALVLDELAHDHAARDRLAALLAPHLPAPATSGADDPWLGTAAAAAHAGCTIGSLRKGMASGDLRYEQAGPGCKQWLRRSDVDAWRRGDETT